MLIVIIVFIMAKQDKNETPLSWSCKLSLA